VRKIAQAAERNKRVFVLDEAYIGFADGENVASAIPMLKEFSNLLIVRTLSKEASLAGLRIGFAMGNKELIDGLCRVRDSFNSYTVGRPVMAGAMAALADASYYDEINIRIINTRRRVSAGLTAMGFMVSPSQANFIFAAPPETCKKSGHEFYTALREKGFLVRHFNKPRISDYLRISIGTDNDMDAFLGACGEILSQK
jgi:histidinol-phosphate aminotransferase